MTIKKTIRTKAIRTNSHKQIDPEIAKQLSSTMPIPVEALIDNIPERTNAAHISISYPGQDGIIETISSDELTIGRDENCSIFLPLTNVSRNHARIIFNGDEYFIEDLNSTNGTIVNNVKVSKCTLRDNDQIQIGQATITFLHQRNQRK